MTRASTIALVFGYTRKHWHLEYNVKLDDFVNVISKYLAAPQIKVGKYHQNIDAFNEKEVRLSDIYGLNETFIVARVSVSNLRKMLSLYNWYIYLQCLTL